MSGVDAEHAENWRGLLWLALPPLWTGDSALGAGFPAEDPPAFVTWAVRHEHATRRGGAMPERFARSIFWCPPDRRRASLSAAVDELGLDLILAEARQAADRLRHFARNGRVPAATLQWAKLVDSVDQPDAATAFLAEVRQLCTDGRREAARDLAGAADALLPLASAEFIDGVERAHRWLLLADRRARDLELMEHYFDRAEWTRELTGLLAGSEDAAQWALHLAGLGGSGKTMFVRYVASGRFADEVRPAPLPVARVDFDHLSPDFPVRRPVELLVEFADELAPYIPTGSGDGAGEGDRALAAFTAIARSARAARLDDVAGDGTGDLVATSISAFAGFVETLPSPVLLILDTCEELARLSPFGGGNRGVDFAFELLERIHQAAPTVRVLLSGRRPLARQAGHPATSGLTDRRYLRLLPARGFQSDEATAFLRRPDAGDVMGDALIEEIKRLSPELLRSVDRPAGSDDDGPRFSPYYLNMYRRWWASKKSIKAGRLRKYGRYAYVDVRILPKLEPGLIGWLPAVALLGRFDERMLAPGRSGLPDAGAAIRALAELEWVDVDTDPVSRSPILEVEGPFQPILLAWAHEHHPTDLVRARTDLARELARQVRERPLAEVSTALVVAALRLAEPRAAVHLWERIERRTAVENGWARTHPVCSRVLGLINEGADESAQPPPVGDQPFGLLGNALLAAAIRATMIALARRDDLPMDLDAAWVEVGVAAARHTGAAARRLSLRARLGRLTAALAAEPAGGGRTVLFDEVGAALEAARSGGRALAGSVAAVAEAVLDTGRSGTDLQPVLPAVRDWLTRTPDLVVRAVLRVLLRRISPAAGTGEPPRRGAKADAAVDAFDAAPGDGRWADWTAPAHCGTWVYLHEAYDAYRRGTPLPELPMGDWEEQARATLSTIDGERLMSLCLRLRLGYGLVPRADLDRWRLLGGYDPHRRPVRAVHHSVPPLFVSLSEAYLVAGDAGVAFAVLRERRAEATGERQEDETVRDANRGIVRLARRLRDDGLAPSVRRRPDAGQSLLQAAVWATNALVDGRSPAGWGHGDDLRRWHDCWQAQAVDVRTGRVWTPVAPNLDQVSLPSDLAVLLAGDAREASRTGSGPGADALRRWLSEHPEAAEPPAEPGHESPLVLARTWLSRTDRFGVAARGRHVPTLAPLHEAMVAIELGELRALRDPAGALPLFELALELAGPCSPVIALQAATLRALAVLHAGAGGPLPTPRSVAVELSGVYDRFRAHVGADLPAWQALADTGPDVGEAPTGPWHGWLARIRVAAQGLIADSGGVERSIAAPAGSVELYAGAFPQPAVVPPRPVGFRQPALSDRPAPIAGSEKPPARADFSMLVPIAGRIAGEPRLTVTVGGTPRRLTVEHDRLPPTWGSEPNPRLRRFARHLMRPALRTVFVLDEKGDRDIRDRLAEIPPAAVDLVLGPRTPYAIGRLRLPEPDQLFFWEERLAELADRPGRPPVIWYREWPAGPGLPPPGWSREMLVIASPRMRSGIERITRRFPTVVRPGYAAGSANPLAGRTDGAGGVLHVIGRPVPDRNGVLLQIGEDAARATMPAESLVNPDDIAGYGASVVVLQGAPYAGRLRVDQVESIAALRFAVDAMLANAPAVVLVPALPRGAAEDVVGLVADVAGRRDGPGPAALVGLAAAVRTAITGDAGAEAAPSEIKKARGQVLVFLRSEGAHS